VQAIPRGLCRVGEFRQLAQLDQKHLEVIKEKLLLQVPRQLLGRNKVIETID